MTTSALPNIPGIHAPNRAGWFRTVRICGPARASWTAAMLGEAAPAWSEPV